MNVDLINKLGAGIQRSLASDTVQIRRYFLYEDGIGGQTETWRTIATLKVRLTNTSDSESVVGGGIASSGGWVMMCDRSADIMANDRIYQESRPDHYFEVVGTDFGQSQLLVQHVTLVERYQ